MVCSCNHEISETERDASVIGTIRDEVESLGLVNCPVCFSTRSFAVSAAEADAIDAEMVLRRRVEAARSVHYARQLFDAAEADCAKAIQRASATTEMLLGALGLAQ